MKKLGIIGCGWLGIRIAKQLLTKFEVHATTNSVHKIEEFEKAGILAEAVNFPDHEISVDFNIWSKVQDLDVIIITVPFSKRTAAVLLEARFENLSYFIKGFDKQLFLMSSIGIYPQVEAKIQEDSLPKTMLHPGLLLVENLMKSRFPNLNILRLGGLMGDDRYLSKYSISNLQQPANHVHYEDIARILTCMMEMESEAKTYNVVAPRHPSKEAIINYQKGLSTEEQPEDVPGRIILSYRCQTELNYTFSHPDPKLFQFFI